MCLLVYKQPDVRFPDTQAVTAARANSDGFGIAYFADGRWQIHRTLELREHLEHLDAASAHAALIHYRMATHGEVTLDNVHPFLVGEPDDPQSFVVAHNGILDVPATADGRSDTRVFVDHVFKHLRRGWIHDPTLADQLEHLIGSYNKIAVLTADGYYRILNEGAGHWATANDHKHTWYSNNSYQSYKPVHALGKGAAAVVDTAATKFNVRADDTQPWRQIVGWSFRMTRGVTEHYCEPCTPYTLFSKDSEVEHRRGYAAQQVAPGSFEGGLQCTSCGSLFSRQYRAALALR